MPAPCPGSPALSLTTWPHPKTAFSQCLSLLEPQVLGCCDVIQTPWDLTPNLPLNFNNVGGSEFISHILRDALFEKPFGNVI